MMNPPVRPLNVDGIGFLAVLDILLPGVDYE